jgi:hypothetical protein
VRRQEDHLERHEAHDEGRCCWPQSRGEVAQLAVTSGQMIGPLYMWKKHVDNRSCDLRWKIIGAGDVQEFGASLMQRFPQDRLVHGSIAVVCRHATEAAGQLLGSAWNGLHPTTTRRVRQAAEALV